jgi:hypothetical protein
MKVRAVYDFVGFGKKQKKNSEKMLRKRIARLDFTKGWGIF